MGRLLLLKLSFAKLCPVSFPRPPMESDISADRFTFPGSAPVITNFLVGLPNKHLRETDLTPGDHVPSVRVIAIRCDREGLDVFERLVASSLCMLAIDFTMFGVFLQISLLIL